MMFAHLALLTQAGWGVPGQCSQPWGSCIIPLLPVGALT